MSTKTTFKRVALVAVAALGLGVLSSVPSQASVPAGNITISGITAGTVTAAKSDSVTAASFALTYLKTATSDSVAVTTTLKSKPTTATGTNVALMPLDTATSSVANTFSSPALGESTTAGVNVAFSGSGYVGGTFAVFLESATTTRKAGTYVVTVIVTPYESGAAVAANVKSFDLTITQAALTAESTSTSAATSTAYMSEGSSFVAGTTTDSTIAVAATASGTAKAVVRVSLLNSSSVALAAESVTVTIDKGVLGSASSTNLGAQKFVYQYTKGSNLDVFVFANGTSGVATINISTPSVTFPAKTITWFGTTYKTITAAPYASVIGTGSATVAVAGLATDENAASFGSAIAVYAYSSDTSVVSDYGTACTYNSTAKAALCSLTGVKDGTANITLRDAATVAGSVAVSNAVALRVSTAAAATVKLSTDKASYAPGEKGYLLIKVLDKDGKVLPAATSATLFATGGIISSANLGSASDTLTAVSITTAVSTSAPLSVDPVKIYTFYAPASGGNFTFSATGGASLPTAGQVAVSTPLTVTDSGAAALAAVTALATTVASLKTLIVTLTNLVLKIQKKVKA